MFLPEDSGGEDWGTLGKVQEISNSRTVPERTPKKPEYLIARSPERVPLVRSHSIFGWNDGKQI